MKIILFGTGNFAEQTYGKINKMPDGIELLGFTDNDMTRWGEVWGKPCFPPSALKDIEYDKIIILSMSYYEEIRNNLVFQYQVNNMKIEDYTYLLKLLFIEKYKNSQDKEIQEILQYWKNHKLSVFNQYIEKSEDSWEVHWDSIEYMPYIIFEDKRMYFPCDTKFEEKNGKKVVKNLLDEQQETSPHLYLKDDIIVQTGDVIVDAGVCEGNFILRHIEKASKAYLFESDKRWKKPLELSMKKFADKVVMCDRFLGKQNNRNTVTLDTIVHGRLDFLKMDIEGAEVDSLIGGHDILTKNNVKCAICSYHNHDDKKRIEEILHTYGYNTNVSNGYMVFYWDTNIFSDVSFRKGIVYARKNKT